MFSFFRKNKEQVPQDLNELTRIDLDVREEMHGKQDPFGTIMNAVKTLKKQDMLVLHSIIKPTPLIGIMKLKGFAGKSQKAGDNHWTTTFVHSGYKHLLQLEQEDEEKASAAFPRSEEPQTIRLDNRGLQPPQPMVRTLDALTHAVKGDTIIIHNDRVPAFLLEELQGMGYPYEIQEQTDGTAIVTIAKN